MKYYLKFRNVFLPTRYIEAYSHGSHILPPQSVTFTRQQAAYISEGLCYDHQMADTIAII
jgi:hypothetical protein